MNLKVVLLMVLVASAASSMLKNKSQEQVELDQCIPGSPGMFKFLGHNIVKLQENLTATFQNFCFKNNQASFFFTSALEIEVNIYSTHPKDLLCSDTFFVTSITNMQIHTKFVRGASTHFMKLSSQEDADYIRANGLTIIPACDKLINFLPDIFETALLFTDYIGVKKLPPKVETYLQLKIYKKLEELGGQSSFERNPNAAPIDLNWLNANVRSGDVYCLFTPSSTDMLVLYGTGGNCEHTGMFLWDSSKVLWMVESNTPVVHKFTAQSWIHKLKAPTTYTMNLLRLRPDLSASFNADAAWSAFNQYNGFPYGYENFLFSFLDTPEDNVTPFMNTDLILTMVAIADKLPIPTVQADITQYVLEAMNHRLGTQNLDMNGLLEQMAIQKLSIGQVMAIPENPNWTYGVGTPFEGKRFICSAMTTYLLKAGGALGDVTVVPQEFTPNDVFNLNIWEQASQRPALCVSNDPKLPYCQLSGMRSLVPFRFSAFTPYNHMNESCPALAPSYQWPTVC